MKDKMVRITISGLPGAGKNTTSKFIAKKLKLKHYSVGDFRRDLAAKKHMTIHQLNKLGEKSIWSDKIADDWQKALAKKDNFIIDGRLSWYFIPNSIKVFLKVSELEGAKRIFLERRKSEGKYKSLKQVVSANKERVKSDIKRYKKYYKLNPYALEHYDIIIDTSNLSKKQMNNAVLKAVQRFIGK